MEQEQAAIHPLKGSLCKVFRSYTLPGGPYMRVLDIRDSMIYLQPVTEAEGEEGFVPDTRYPSLWIFLGNIGHLEPVADSAAAAP